MKKIIILLIALNLSCASKAQIFDLNNCSNYAQVPNAYFKDLSNFQNQFVGTWIYQNGSERLEMKFRKIEMMLKDAGPNQYYEDVLVGEYKYIDANGLEKVNSLPNLEMNYPSLFDYNLYSVTKKNAATHPICRDCPEGPRLDRMYMFFDEAGNDDFGLEAAFIMSHTTENGVEKLKVKLMNYSYATNENKANLDLPSVFREFSVPYGYYTLIKQ